MKVSKRIFDIVVSLLLLLILFPILIVIAVLILVLDGKPVLFRQIRVGHKGRNFVMLKFRTMRHSKGKSLVTVDGDTRITQLGKFLRSSKLDELPQLVNVIAGEMSLVGPRPEVEKYVSVYSESMKQVLELVPGITDFASLVYANESELLATQLEPEAFYEKHVVPHKIQLNLEYARSATFWSDLKILCITALIPLGKKPHLVCRA